MIRTKTGRHEATQATFVHYSRLQTGGCSENLAEFSSTAVHVVVGKQHLLQLEASAYTS